MPQAQPLRRNNSGAPLISYLRLSLAASPFFLHAALDNCATRCLHTGLCRSSRGGRLKLHVRTERAAFEEWCVDLLVPNSTSRLTRSRLSAGCSTCRRRKVKCGEERPICKRCLNLSLNCEWGVPVKRGRGGGQIRHLQPAPTAPEQSLWSVSEVGDVVDISSDALLAGFSPTSWPGDPTILEASRATTFYPPVAPARIPTPLYPPLSTNEIACANSLTLTEHDQKYFQYFPSSSIVYYYMKGWHWSSFCYLYQGPATTNKVIMRMILALSASDMHRNGLVVRSPGRPTADDHGRYHYSLAVKEFRQLLETPRRQVSVEELETIFATMLLMVTYEWQFGHSVRHLQLHLHGVRSLLESHPQLFRLKDVNDVFLSPGETDGQTPEGGAVSKVSFIPEQFLLWIL